MPEERIGNFTISEGPYKSLKDTTDAFPAGISVVFDPFVAKDHPIDPRYALGMRLCEKSRKNHHIPDVL